MQLTMGNYLEKTVSVNLQYSIYFELNAYFSWPLALLATLLHILRLLAILSTVRRDNLMPCLIILVYLFADLPVGLGFKKMFLHAL